MTKHIRFRSGEKTQTSKNHFGSNAARAVFNIHEILEQILKSLPMDFLGRALSVSRYCRNVILGSAGLRCTLFLEPALTRVESIIKVKETWLGCLYNFNLHSNRKRIVVEAHPLLTSVKLSLQTSLFRRSMRGDPRTSQNRLPYDATHKILCCTIDKVPAAALIIQPPPPEVQLFFIFRSVVLTRPGGVTFDVLREEIKRQRKECRKMVDRLSICAWTPEKRARFAEAMRVFGRVRSKGCRIDLQMGLSEPCVFLNVRTEKRDGLLYES